MGTLIITMCEGIRHGPYDPDARRSDLVEAQLSAQYLIKAGVPVEDVITDDLSLDLIGNAYFLRTTHTDVVKARNLVVVTNEFHAVRTKAIFVKVFSLPPRPSSREAYSLTFEVVENVNIKPEALQRRREWESQQFKYFLQVSQGWKNLHDVHACIFRGGTPLTAIRPTVPSIPE